MKKANTREASSWFDVLLTARHTQAAVMRLDTSGVSSESLNTHATSDQVLLVLDGAVRAEVGTEKADLSQGDVVIVPAGTPHRFRSAGSRPAVTFNVSSPPAY